MSANRDLIQLKLQKKLLEEQIYKTDGKIQKLGNILVKKTVSRPSLLHPEDYTFTSSGHTVSELRANQNPIKSRPVIQTRDPYSMEPVPVTNERILNIRQQFLIHTTGRQEVQRKIAKKAEKEKKAQKKEKSAPKIKVPESMLPNRYLRGELPCTIEHGGPNGKYLSWACPLENLDYEYYLPVFFDGLQCNDNIVAFIARQGIEDLLYASKGHPERIIPVIPNLVRPLRNALSTFNREVLLGVLKVVQQLITCNEGIGDALLKYGRQFLAPMGFFMEENKNLGDSIDYGQRKGDDVGEEVKNLIFLYLFFLLICCDFIFDFL
jgi:hypothetical protein